MKLPLSAIKKFIDIDLSPNELSKRLTLSGLEVDSFEEVGNDVIFEISLTPNLSHCFSVMGVARELAAALDLKVKYPTISFSEKGDENPVKVTVLDKMGCPRYACRVIRDVRMGPSPEWLQNFLTACDMRPINIIVDITNYVLMEMGHPLHAFDFDTLNEIIVKKAQGDETFLALDGNEYRLTADDLMICDQNRPVAIAGVMGGSDSEVKETTRNILLESAYFHPSTVRKTSKRLGILTEASRRFERGCDPNNVLNALNRATQLIEELANGKVCNGFVDVKENEFPKKVITCRLSRINQLLGTQLSLSEVESLFKRLEMSSKWDGMDVFTVSVPTYRVDIQAEIDLIEEAARIFGYDNIPKKGARFQSSLLPNAPIFDFEREVRNRLLGTGLQEFLTCDLIGPTLLNIVQLSMLQEVKVLNPTSIEQSVLRTSLLPGFLQLVKYNIDHQSFDVSGFEIGRIHFKENDSYREQSMMGVILTGLSRPHHWDRKPKEFDFFDLKGMIENLFQELRTSTPVYKKGAFSVFHPGRQASIFIDDVEVGSFGEIHPAIMRRLDVNQRIYFAEIDLHLLLEKRKPEPKMVPLSVLPSSGRDLTLTLKNEISNDEIIDVIRSLNSNYLEKVSLLDVYKSEKIGNENKNVTFHFVYRDNKKTLAQETVEAEHARIITELESRFCRR